MVAFMSITPDTQAMGRIGTKTFKPLDLVSSLTQKNDHIGAVTLKHLKAMKQCSFNSEQECVEHLPGTPSDDEL